MLIRIFFFQGSHKTYGRGLDDGSGLDNLLLVHLGTRTVKVTDDGGHTGLVAHGGSQVNGLLGVILGEAGAQHVSVYLELRKKIFSLSQHSSDITHLLTFPR